MDTESHYVALALNSKIFLLQPPEQLELEMCASCLLFSSHSVEIDCTLIHNAILFAFKERFADISQMICMYTLKLVNLQGHPTNESCIVFIYLDMECLRWPASSFVCSDFSGGRNCYPWRLGDRPLLLSRQQNARLCWRLSEGKRHSRMCEERAACVLSKWSPLSVLQLGFL